MYEMAFRGGFVFVLAEHGELVPHGTVAEPRDAHADRDLVRVGNGAAESAARFDDIENRDASAYLDQTVFEQEHVHGRVEKRIVHDVVHVPVLVVVAPSRGDLVKAGE